MANVFLSYSSEDKTLISRFAEQLREQGFTVWWDREIPVGESYADVLERQIKNSDCVVVIWTKRSIQSQWVKNEATIAERLKKLVPVMLEEVDLPIAFMHVETALLFQDAIKNQTTEHELFYQAIQRCIQQNRKTGTKPEGPAPRPPAPPASYAAPVSRNRKTLWYVIAAIALIGLLILLWKFFGKKETAETIYQFEGHVYNVQHQPVAQVELNIEGTPFYATSEADGYYTFSFTDYNQLSSVAITTSSDRYRDTTLRLQLKNKEKITQDFILTPILNSN
jgi:hypothetical protein